MSKLIIDNISEDLLISQLESLTNILGSMPANADTDNCYGLLNMLEVWKDKICLPVRIEVKSWFDKVNGNSYWSSRAYVEGELVVVLPMNYGYDDHGVQETMEQVAEYLNKPEVQGGFRRYCREHNIILDYTIETGCLKKDMVSHGTE